MSLKDYFTHRAAEAEMDRQWYEDRPGNWRHEREAEEERDYWLSRANACSNSHSYSCHSCYHDDGDD